MELLGQKIQSLVTSFMPDCALKVLCYFKMLSDIYRFFKHFWGFYNLKKKKYKKTFDHFK